MPVLRINAQDEHPVPHQARGTAPVPFEAMLDHALERSGPVTIMIHGFKFAPGHRDACPHSHIFSLGGGRACKRAVSWPRRLGYGRQRDAQGFGIAFGWNAIGTLRQAQGRADVTAVALARLVRRIRARDPARAINLLTHSLGGHVALSALPHLSAGDLDRVVLMNPAAFQGQAASALDTPAGRSCELFNVTSRENAMYDLGLELLAPPAGRRDRAMGRGFEAANALTLKLDQPQVLDALVRLGFRIAPPSQRICHWSTYMRPGVFPFYRALFARAPGLGFAALRAAATCAAPDGEARRWPSLPRWPLSPA